MSLLFADIYEAIRCLRIQKGACEKDILNYVQEKVGGCMKVKNVLKTIRTLKKLVDNGVLVKNGKRYTFARNGQQCEEEEEEEEEECEEDKPDECKIRDCCDDEGDDEDQDQCKDDDEDDDDDEEEEEEEEEDDDDEDEDCEEEEEEDECNDNNEAPEDDCSQNDFNKNNASMECTPRKLSITNKASTKVVEDVNNGDPSANPQDKCQKVSRIPSQGRNVIEQSNEGKAKGEVIGFCARDFIDSLYRSKTMNKEREKHEKLDILPQENMDDIERCETPREKKQKYQKKRSNLQQCNFRSRSPIEGIESDMFHSLKRDRMDDLCFRTVSSTLLQEPTDADMDIDLEQERDVGTDLDSFRHRSPTVPLLSDNTGLHVPRQETSCSNHEMKKMEASSEIENEYALTKNLQYQMSQLDNKENNQMNWYSLDGRDKALDKYKRETSFDDERNVNDEEKNVSLCSVCEKKKIGS